MNETIEGSYTLGTRILTLCPEGSFIKTDKGTEREFFTGIFVCIDTPNKDRVRISLADLANSYLERTHQKR